MQFDFDQSIKGDLEVTARGTESLMANEVRSQRLMQFLQIASSPALMPFAKFPYIIREIAKSMDLDPDKVTNNMDEAMRQALMMQQATAPAEGAPPVAGPEGGPPPVADMTGGGGGNIGVGAAPVPGEQGFAGNVQAVDLIDAEIAQQHKNLEQASDAREIGKAQGAIAALRRLKHLKDEVNVHK
jgi:hypothetical protein